MWLCDRQKDCESGEDEHDQLCGEYSVCGCVIDRRTVSNNHLLSLYNILRKRQQHYTVWVRLIRSHSSARFCFELSGNLNYKIICNSNFAKNFGIRNLFEFKTLD